MTIGDLDADGKLDLAVASINSDQVSILLGNGSGGFAHAPGSPLTVAPIPWSVVFTDMDADGRLDLAVLSQSNSVEIRLNQTIVAADGTSCDDANVCTAPDSCTGGICSGIPVPAPAEVDNGLRVNRSGGTAVISWNLATGATSSAVLRGLVSALPVGPGGGDESCLNGNVPGNTLQWPDAPNPASGASFWYLVRGDNACGKGPYGFRAQNGTPTVARISTTCP
jgi:hypothetical protein